MSDNLQTTNPAEVQLITRPCARCLEESRNLVLFLARTFDIAGAFDQIVNLLSSNVPSLKKLAERLDKDPEQIRRVDEDLGDFLMEMKTRAEEIKKQDFQYDLEQLREAQPFLDNLLTTHKNLLSELLLCRAVDNFLTYLSEILALIYRTRPETLRSNETVRLDKILQYKSMDELIAALAEKRVNELSYSGLKELSENLSNRLGFPLFEEGDTLANATRIVETRNIIVHNRAVINDRFLSRVPNYPAAIGETVVLDRNVLWGDIQFLKRSVKDIDSRAVAKFNLPTPNEKDPLW
jgi:hypothetical protein